MTMQMFASDRHDVKSSLVFPNRELFHLKKFESTTRFA